jgi:hypothetical protein
MQGHSSLGFDPRLTKKGSFDSLQRAGEIARLAPVYAASFQREASRSHWPKKKRGKIAAAADISQQVISSYVECMALRTILTTFKVRGMPTSARL